MSQDAEEIVTVTIRLTSAEFVINPATQTMRVTQLDGVGRPMGQTDEISLDAAIGALRGLRLTMPRSAP